MSVAELLAHEPDPDEARIRDVLSGHLCRCTGYQNIVDAVLLAARRMRGVAHERPRSGRTRRGRRDGEGTPRIEDAALLRGEARFLDDIPVATPLHACFVRSPHAHARIVSIDLSAARAMPGVTAAYAAADLYGELTEWRMPLGFALADLPANTTPFVLAGSEVAFAGEAVTVVLADSRRQAEDAAAVARVEYEALAAVADCRAALEEDRRACAASWNRTCCSAIRWNTGIARPRSPGRPGCSPSASGRIEAPRIRWKGAACWRRRTRPAMR